MSEEEFDSAATAVQALAENADRLGLTWGMRPATVQDYNIETNKALAIYDGDEESISMVSLAGPLLPNFRVMAMQVPPAGNFIVSTLGVPKVGELVIRLRTTGTQSIADAGAGEFVQFQAVEHNLYGVGFSTGENTKYMPPVPGYYMFNGRAVWTANAVSRRGAFININGTTATPGTVGGQSLQAPATGSCQIQAIGTVFLNGDTDYVGLRVLQNSGAPLTLATTDGGSVLEGFYAGAFRPRGQ